MKNVSLDTIFQLILPFRRGVTGLGYFKLLLLPLFCMQATIYISFLILYDDHLRPSISENDNETIKAEGDY